MAFVRFAYPTFRGGRFEGNALPVDVLPELSAYREVIVDLAKYLFIQSHPTRQRVPRGFVDSFRLVLRNVEPGSARPILELLVPDQAQPALLFGDDYFARARDQIANAVHAASARQALPNDFPRALIPQFNQFGKSLRPNEYIELRDPAHEIGPRYDRDTRRYLILQYRPEYEASVDLIAEIRGGVLDREQITFRLPDGTIIDAKAPESAVQEIFPMVPSQVRVIGSGVFDQNDRLKSIVHIEELTATEDDIPVPTPLADRIAQLGALQEGWFRADSRPLDQRLLTVFSNFIGALLADGTIPPPFVYPTPEGNVQAEWSFPSWEVSVMIVAATEMVCLHAVHLDGDDDREIELPAAPHDTVTTLRGVLLECVR